jgi:hypothetical protein
MRLPRINLHCASLLVLTFALSATVSASAASTPPPGGANQITAVSGRVGQRVFNGVLRVTVQDVHDATADDHPEKDLPSPDKKIIVMHVLLSNGSHEEFDSLMEYTLADADNVTVEISQPYVHPANLSIAQGAAAKQLVHVPVDKDFKPVKLLIECGGCASNSGFRPLRITIPQ